MKYLTCRRYKRTCLVSALTEDPGSARAGESIARERKHHGNADLRAYGEPARDRQAPTRRGGISEGNTRARTGFSAEHFPFGQARMCLRATVMMLIHSGAWNRLRLAREGEDVGKACAAEPSRHGAALGFVHTPYVMGNISARCVY
jgi:hypothetical protein